MDWQIPPEEQARRDRLARTLVEEEAAADPGNPFLAMEIAQRFGDTVPPDGETAAPHRVSLDDFDAQYFGGEGRQTQAFDPNQFDADYFAQPVDASAPPEDTFGKGFKRAFAQVPELAYGAGALAAMSAEKLFGEGGLSTGAKLYFGRKYSEKAEANQQYAPGVQFTDAWAAMHQGDFGPLSSWLKDSAGYVVGQGLQTVLTGGIGALAGKAALKGGTERLLGSMVAKGADKLVQEAAKKGVKLSMDVAMDASAKRIAAAVGAGVVLNAQNLGMEAGDIYGGLTREAQESGREITGDDLVRAWGAAGMAALTETATDLLGLGALTGRIKIGTKSIQEMTGAGGRLARGAVGAGVGAPLEGAQEWAQTWLEQYGAGAPTDTPEAEMERINAAAVGALGGQVLGGGAGLLAAPRQATLDDKQDRQRGAEAAGRIASAGSVDEAINLANQASETHAQTADLRGRLLAWHESERQRRMQADLAARNELVQLVESERAAKQAQLDAMAEAPPDAAPTQEQLLGRMSQDADALRAERQKQAELEQLANESRVPAALFDAERNDRVNAAAGIGEDQPTALALAFQRARQRQNEQNQSAQVDAASNPLQRAVAAGGPGDSQAGAGGRDGLGATPAAPVRRGGADQPVGGGNLANAPLTQPPADTSTAPDISQDISVSRETISHAESRSYEELNGGQIRRQVPRGRARSLLELVRRSGGIKPDLSSDIIGEKAGKRGVPVGVFRNGGMAEDMLAELLLQHGYLTDADVDSASDTSGAGAAIELVRRALKGERITPLADQEEEQSASAESAYRNEIRAMARELGVRVVGRTFSSMEEEVLRLDRQRIEREEAALDERERAAYDEVLRLARKAMDDDAVDEALERLAVQHQDDTLREYRQAAIAYFEGLIHDARQAQAAQVVERERAEQGDPPGGTPAGERGVDGPFDLQAQTDAELRGREEALAARRREEAEAERTAKQKAQADAERDSFALAGSDRDADVAASGGQDALFEPETDYATNEPGAAARRRDGYTEDLFGDTLPAAGAVRHEGGQQPRPAAHRDILAASTVPGAKFATVAVQRETGEVKSAFQVIDSAERAAHVLAGLRKYPQEHFAVLVLDRNRRPLAVLRLFSGGTAQTSAYPEVVAKAVYEIPGAAHVWYAHNHPSGFAEASSADIRLTSTMSQVFGAGTGVEVDGHVIIAGTRAVALDSAGGWAGGSFPIPAGARKHAVKLTERVFHKIGFLGDSIGDPSAARVAIPEIANGQTGIVFNDAQSRPVAFLPMNATRMMNLRNGGDTSNARILFGAAARSNASSVFLNFADEVPTEDARDAAGNLHAALSDNRDIRVLDAIHRGESLASSGGISSPRGQGVFLSRRTDAPQIDAARDFILDGAPGLSSVEEVQDELGLEIGKTKASRVKVIRSAAHLPAALRKEVYSQRAFDVQGLYDPDTDTAYLIADNIAPGSAFAVLMHEVGVHQGLERFIGAAAFNALAARIERWAQFGGDTAHGRLAKLARSRVPSDTPAAVRREELVAYFVEEAVKAGHGVAKPSDQGLIAKWFQQLREAVAAALEKLGVKPLELATDDVVALARGALERELGGERRSAAKAPEPAGALESRAAQNQPPRRATGFDRASSAVIADSRDDATMKAHPDYKAAKAGDVDAAARMVQGLVTPESIEAAQQAFGADAIYVPVHALEAAGKNQIPNAIALHYAAETGAEVDDAVVQTNRAYHTGANAMERLLARAEFSGDVTPGRRYVLVDDVTTMGSTLADMANFIRSQGGEVVGSVVLVDANRSGTMVPSARTVRELESRHGDEIRKLFGIAPGALTASEAQYLLGFRTTDELRNRVAKAGQERLARLRAKGLLPEGQDPQGGVAPRFSRAAIVGDSGRSYDRAQRDFFKNVGREVERKNAVERTLEYLRSDFWKKMAVGIVDQFRGLRDLQDGGQAYLLARLSKGTAGAFDAILHHGKLSLRDGVYDADTSGGFVERLGVPLKGELDDVLWWIAANRAEKLAGEGRENLFTPRDIAAGKSLATGATAFDYTIQTGPAKGRVTRDRTLIYADAQRVFNEFQKNALDMAEQSGLINGATRQYWESEFYVPFYRVSEEEGEFIGARMGNALVRQQAFKKLKGGSDKLNSDLLSNTLLNWSHLIEASAKNRAAKASLEAAEQIGAAHQALPGEKKTVWFMDNGQKREYKVTDPFVLTAITSLEYAGMRNPVMDVMTKFKHWLTVGVTASPAFKVRNLIRDSIQAIGTSDLSYNPLKNVKEGWKFTDRASQDYVSALASGGLIRFGTMLEGSESSRVRQLIKQGVKDSTILNSESKLQRFYDLYLEPAVSAYNELGNRGEEINRAALYNQLIKQGKSHAEAALMARDLMDFSMQGSFATVRFLTQVVPFMNARLQGLYKLGRSAKDHPRKLAVVTGAVATASIALMLANMDDDDWKRREDWDRDNFWWFKFGGVAFRIPKPFEVGAIGTVAERTVEYLVSDEMNGERYRDVLTALVMHNLSMNPVPQAVKPVIDIYSNRDSFTDRPIENLSMQRLDPTERYTSGTSMVARGLSVATAGMLSPVQYDHVIRSYFGWLGATSVGFADWVYRLGSDEPTRPTMDYWKVATQGIMKEVDGDGSRYLSLMYDQAKELEQAHATYRQMVKEGRTEEAKEYAEDNLDKLRRYRAVAKVKRQEAKLNERIRMIERSNIDPDEKKAIINAIKAQKERVAKRVAPGV